MSFVDAAMAATAQQQKYTPYRARREASLWLDAASLSACSQFWYDESEYHGYSDEPYLALPTKSGAYLSLPDSDTIDITGDLDIRACVYFDDISVSQAIVAKSTSDPNRSFLLSLTTGKRLGLSWSTTGNAANQIYTTSSAGVTYGSKEKFWIRATLDVDNGSGQYVVTYYLSSDGVAWTQHGSTTVGGTTTSIAATAAPLEIGSRANGSTDNFGGRVYSAEVRNGINGTIVAAFNPQTYLENKWTLNGQTLNGEYPVIVNHAKVPRYRAMLGSGALADTSDPKILTVNEPAHVRFIAGTNSYISKPKIASSINLSSNFEITARVALTNWQATAQGVINMYQTGGNQRSWTATLDSGCMAIQTSNDGANNVQKNSVALSTVVSALNGEYLDLRWRFRKVGTALLVTYQSKTPTEVVWQDLGFVDTTYSTLFDTSTNILIGCRYTTDGSVVSGVMDGKIAYVEITQDGVVTDSFNAANPGPEWTLTNVSVTPEKNDPYLYSPGTVGNYITAASYNAVSVPTSFSLVVDLEPELKWASASGWERVAGSFPWIFIGTTGLIQATYGNGSGYPAATSTAGIPWTKHRGQVRVDVFPHGSGGTASATFYYRSSGDVASLSGWTQLGDANVPFSLSGDPALNTKYITLPNQDSTPIKAGKFFAAAQFVNGALTKRFNPLDTADWTLYTSSTGNRARIITRNSVMFDGVNDYITVPNHSRLNAGTGSLTAFVAGNADVHPGTYARTLNKGSGANAPGYAMPLNSSSNEIYGFISDGTNAVYPHPTSTTPLGRDLPTAMVVNRALQVCRIWNHNGFGIAHSTTSVGSIDNSLSLDIGRRSSANDYYLPMTITGVAIWKSALTGKDLQVVGKKFTPERFGS